MVSKNESFGFVFSFMIQQKLRLQLRALKKSGLRFCFVVSKSFEIASKHFGLWLWLQLRSLKKSKLWLRVQLRGSVKASALLRLRDLGLCIPTFDSWTENFSLGNIRYTTESCRTFSIDKVPIGVIDIKWYMRKATS